MFCVVLLGKQEGFSCGLFIPLYLYGVKGHSSLVKPAFSFLSFTFCIPSLIEGLWVPYFLCAAPYLESHSCVGGCVVFVSVQGFFVVLGCGVVGFLCVCVCIHNAGRHQGFFDLILPLAMLRKEKQGDFEGTVVKIDNNRLDEIFENLIEVKPILEQKW